MSPRAMSTAPFRMIALAAVLPLAACAFFGRKPPAKEPFWRFPLVEDGRIFCEGEINPALVATEAGLVVFTTRAGRLYAVDAAKRAVTWTFPARAPVDVPPAVLTDRFILLDREGRVYAIGLDGKRLWETKGGEAPAPDILAFAGKIVLRAGANLIALGAEKGEEIWTLKASAPVRSGLASWRQRIVFGTEDKKLQVASPEGRLLAASDADAAPVGPLIIAGDLAIAGLEDGTIAGWDLLSMKKRWSISLGGIPAAPPAYDGRRLYAVLSNHVLFCFAARSGTTEWWQPLPGRGAFAPALAETHVFATTPSEILLACPRAGGIGTIAFEAPGEIRTAPLWLPPHLWVGFFEPETGRTALVFLKSPPPPEKEKRP